jgi:hypothetical protein
MLNRQNRGRGGTQSPGLDRGGSERYLLNDPRYLEGLMSTSQIPNVAKELVHPGKGDPAELLMRCNIKDERMLNAIVLYYGLCEEFNLPEEKKLLSYRLAGSTSVGGLSRRELIMAATGIIAPSLYSDIGKKMKGREDGKDKEEGQ